MVLLAVPFMAGLTLIITASGEWMLDLGRFLFGFLYQVPCTMCQVPRSTNMLRFLFGFSGGAFALLAPALGCKRQSTQI